LIDFEAQKLSAGAVLLSPFLPLLFMGEEYGETAPFLYFTDHSDPALAKAVRDGRRAEFAGFHGNEEVPDPQSESTFQTSKLDPSIAKTGRHRMLLDLYKELVRVRRQHAAFAEIDGAALHSSAVEKCLVVHRSDKGHESLVIFNFSDNPEACPLLTSDGPWQKLVDSAEAKWAGPGSDVPVRIERASEVKFFLQPRSFCVFEHGNTRDESRATGAPLVRDYCHA